MRRLTIQAASPQSARGFLNALTEFRAVPIKGDLGVTVQLRSDEEIISVLNALEEYVTQRAHGPAQIDLDGQRYTLHALPEGR